MQTPSRRAFLAMLAIVAATARAAAETPQSFALNNTPQPLPEIQFTDGDAKSRTLADFRGKVVLLNIWTTWCPECRQEMPTLDRLQAELGGTDFEVVALSMDRKGPEVVRKFFAETGVEHLALNIDASSTAMLVLKAFGIPTTLLIDRHGREIGRLIGPADWDTPEMVEFIRSRIANH